MSDKQQQSLEGAAEEFDDFLGDGTDLSNRVKGSFVDNWKDPDRKEDRHIDFWFTTRGRPMRFRRHQFPYVGKGRDDKTVIRQYRFNAMESPEAIKRRQWPEQLLENPAVLCPFGRMLDWVARAVDEEKVGWLDPVFRIDPGTGKKDDLEVLYAGGIIGQFKSRKLEDDEKEAMYERTGFTAKNAFKASLMAAERWLIIIVPLLEREKNLILIEGPLVAQKLQKVGRELIEKYGPVKGDPFKTPHAFRLKNMPTASKPDDQYSIVPMTDVWRDDPTKFDDVIKNTLEHGELPDVSAVIGQCNVARLRDYFETYWCHKVVPDWDDIFAPSFAKLKGTEHVQMPTDFEHGANVPDADDSAEDGASEPAPKKEEPKAAASGTVRRTRGSAPEPKKEEPKREQPCANDKCPELHCDACMCHLKDDDKDCPHCGAEYTVNADGSIGGLKHPLETDDGQPGTHELRDGRYVPKKQPEADMPPRARRRGD